MSLSSPRRMVNPQLGVYFAIFSSAILAMTLLALIGEQLATDEMLLRWGLLLFPLVAYAAIGIASRTIDPLDFFAAGRRVPAFYSGLNLATSAMGGTGLVAITGTLFLLGFDALCIVIGAISGFVIMGILLAPFFRKFGAYTISSYLGRRFESTLLRVVSALIIAVPLTMMLAAELKMGAFLVAFLSGITPQQATWGMALTLALTLTLGGTRALTWTGVAQGIVVLFALLIPIGIVAVMWTNLPIPQLSYGPLMRTLARQEATQSLPLVLAQGLTFELPSQELTAIGKRYATSFSAVGPAGFVAALLTIMMGISVAPWLLPRIATTPGVYHARKSIGWATVIFGVMMLTATSIAVFERAILFDQIKGGSLPEWFRTFAALGFGGIEPRLLAGQTIATPLSGLTFSRDAILLGLPMAAGLSNMFIALAAVGGLAACLAGASAATTALGATLSEDVAHGFKVEPPQDLVRIHSGRRYIVFALLLATTIATLIPGDPLSMVLWALALTSSSLFCVLVLSIWWKRLNRFGAVAGVVSGFAVALLTIIGGEFEWLPLDPTLAALCGIPASLAAALIVSVMTPYPGRHLLELVRDIRVPGGEILYDREMRLLRVKQRK